MRRAIGRFLAWMGGLFVLGFLALLVFVVLAKRPKDVPQKTILEVDLETDIVEEQPDNPLAKLAGEKADLRSLLTSLERAQEDAKVIGLVARIGKSKMGMAQVQELRDAVLRFRSKGKFALAFSETFGEFTYGNSAYYLATSFEQIWLQPSGDIGLTGILVEPYFLKSLLEKVGVKPHMDARYEYKSAKNLFTETKMTPAQREATEKIAQGWFGQIVRGIAEGRHLAEGDVKALIDRGPFLGPETIKEKLVDQLGYRDEFYAKAKERAGGGAQLLYLSKYLERTAKAAEKRLKSAKVVALIYGLGGVHRGESEPDPMSGQPSMGSDTVTSAFRAAVADKNVKGILFRVDSPGGSYVASDAIWREVVRARAAGKPVIVSMGNVAGSGGYFVAMAADKIVAEPSTITGSIGVLGGKMITSELLDNKLGVTHDRVSLGQNATMWSTNEDFSPTEWARFQAWLDRVYGDFTAKVAQGRKLPPEKVAQIAKGRIWTGEDAKDIGLVDELGGIDTALKLMRQTIGASDGEALSVKRFPAQKEMTQLLTDKLFGKDPENSEPAAGTRAAPIVSSRFFAMLAPLLRTLAELAELSSPSEAALEMPSVPSAR
jgi:protease-4